MNISMMTYCAFDSIRRRTGAQDQRGFSPVTDISVKGLTLAQSAQWHGCASTKFDNKQFNGVNQVAPRTAT